VNVVASTTGAEQAVNTAELVVKLLLVGVVEKRLVMRKHGWGTLDQQTNDCDDHFWKGLGII